MRAELAAALAEAAASGTGSIAVITAGVPSDLPGAVLHRHIRSMNKKQLMLTLLLLLFLTVGGWVFVGGFLGFGVLSSPVAWLIAFWLLWLLGLGLAALARRTSARSWIIAAIVMLAMFLVMPNLACLECRQNMPPVLPRGLEYALELVVFFMPTVALVLVALLFYSGLTLYKARSNPAGPADVARGTQALRVPAAALALGALLLLVTLYNLYWALVWDSTDDPLSVLLLIFPLFAAVSSGLFLLIALPGKFKYEGLVHLLLIPVLIVAIFVSAKGVDYRQLTEQRAGQVSQAVESYYAREGHYPQDLKQLIPWYALWIPGPIIIQGQDWCYEGGPSYYRLGYADREHWSSPNFTGHLYKAQGVVSELQPICGGEIAVLQKRFPGIYR